MWLPYEFFYTAVFVYALKVAVTVLYPVEIGNIVMFQIFFK